MGVLLDRAGLFLELCGQPDAPVSCAAALCLTAIIAAYPQQCAPWLLAPKSLAIVVGVLQGEHLENQPMPPQTQQCLLEAVSQSLAVPDSAVMSNELLQLAAAVRHLAGLPDPSVKTPAGNVLHLLEPMLA